MRTCGFVLRKCSGTPLSLDEQTGLIGLQGMNRFPVEISYEGTKYSFTVLRQAPDAFTLSINGQVRPSR